jgi:hypothetical protein
VRWSVPAAVTIVRYRLTDRFLDRYVLGDTNAALE